ncbi:protein FRA10AC1 homolog [Bactrocera neohumeralis]|uniref:protein FRA10AC1 homolog n=1 Tax=Bactrocera tryoni TaxID=59916 RepID=UPI001A95B5F9|nr:protein FRA10AC1 homolog [Bactrocera tryoni]XP_050338536.1 protein FRA10AC1 homolog [Bactrocera neohumeralis]
MKSMSLQERHNYILKKFIISDKSFEGKKNSYDIHIIKEHHRFLWDDNELSDGNNSWEVCMARRYYNKLFKEYCIADLTLHKENKVALRWRTRDEVVLGKGQFQCGSRKCEQRENLSSWEVNFAYHEQGENKNALVKLRLCANHSKQLNFTSRKREVKRLKKCSATKGHMLRKNQGNAQVASCFGNIVSEAKEENETGNRIWNRRTNVELEQPSREIEFERYLEDLLL